MTDLQNPAFTDETKAREWLEAQFWPDWPGLPPLRRCRRRAKLAGKSHRPGLY